MHHVTKLKQTYNDCKLFLETNRESSAFVIANIEILPKSTQLFYLLVSTFVEQQSAED